MRLLNDIDVSRTISTSPERYRRLQDDIDVSLLSVETGDVVTVASQCKILFFIENNRLYIGLRIKAIVSHTCLKTRKQLPVEIHSTNSLTPRINLYLQAIKNDWENNGRTGSGASSLYVRNVLI